MSTQHIQTWLENFERQSMLRRALVVSGNIIDLSFAKNGQLQPINQIITDSLKAKGFQHVVFYSRVGGVSGVTTQQWNDLILGYVDICYCRRE